MNGDHNEPKLHEDNGKKEFFSVSHKDEYKKLKSKRKNQGCTDNRPIIGIGRLSAVNRNRPIIMPVSADCQTPADNRPLPYRCISRKNPQHRLRPRVESYTKANKTH